MEILIGCDPELFVKRNGKSVSAHGLIPGDKKNPFKVERGAVQVDGMALEFNIAPAATADEFVVSIDTVMQQLAQMVPGYEFDISPVAHFGQDVIREQPQEALELGCDPDYNSYTGEENPRPDGNRPFRTASGHVHIGWTSGRDINDPDHREDAFRIGRTMDHFLGVASVLLEPPNERRQLYGKAGCVRVKPYGVEYRTMSNFWLKSPKLMRWVFNRTQECVQSVIQGYDVDKEWLFNERLNAINNGDRAAAQNYLYQFGIPLPKV